MSRSGLILLDYDGTLLREGCLDRRALGALEEMGKEGVNRVLATGRSPFSLLRSLEGRPLPVDYLILSTGVGVVSSSGWETLRSLSMGRRRLVAALALLRELDLDFSVHHPFPENHRFSYRRSRGSRAEDLARRLDLYRGFHREMGEGEELEEASQVVAIAADGGPAILERIRERLHPEMKVVRTTSPLDGESMWIELFPASAGKGSAAAWLAGMLQVSPERSLAVGNDYNDLDMLQWAGHSLVMEDSPPGLRRRFPTATCAWEALSRWRDGW